MPSTSSASALRASSSTLVNTPLSPVSQPRALDGREHGFLDDPTANLSAAPKRPPLPEVLVFQSWWNEEDSKPPPNMRSGDGIGRRRQLELRYLTRDGLFQMVTDDAVVPLMRYLHGLGIEAGECATSGLAALLQLHAHASPEFLSQFGLNADSVVVLIGCEGATDAAFYDRVVKEREE